MDIKVDINPEDVNRFVVEAILKSTLGEEVKRVVERKIGELSNSWNNPLDGVVRQHIERCISSLLQDTYRETIRTKVAAAMAGKLTDEWVEKMTMAAFHAVERG